MDKAEESPFIYQPKSSAGAGAIIIDFVQTIVIALAIVVVIYLFIAIPNQVDGQSMEPNFHNNELLLTNKVIQIVGNTSIGVKFDYDYKRGDVVIFQEPSRPDLIKRIIAVGGDTISLSNGKPIVNGKIIEEDYIVEPTYGNTFLREGETKRVPERSYFVLGDNRDNSKDSRFTEVGFVARKYLKGRVFLRYWPFNQFGIIKKGTFKEVAYNQSNQ